jgi:hypothetical protein
MLSIVLYIFLIAGFVVGWIQGSESLKNSNIRYPDKSIFRYWLH